jgi:hypothetical protein
MGYDRLWIEAFSLNQNALLGGTLNVGRLRQGRCNGYQDPVWVNGRSYGQMGSGNHTCFDHLECHWIDDILDYYGAHGGLAHEDVVYVESGWNHFCQIRK